MSRASFLIPMVFRRGLITRKNHLLKLTQAGFGYFCVWLGLLAIGLYSQNNLILLMSGIAAGPILASFVMSSGMLRRLTVSRRAPESVFSGDPLVIHYSLENSRSMTAALAVGLLDDVKPRRPMSPREAKMQPSIMFERVAAGTTGRSRWEGLAPARGRYEFSTLALISRAPFGLIERKISIRAPGELIVYPRQGELQPRWHKLLRESVQTRRGQRQDRTAQQQDYHGLREYRSGDSPRWIHWRTSARTGELMVKEFEQDKDQFLALLLDPWLPTKPTAQQNLAVEEILQFAATVCVETCRQPGRRMLLAWTGATPSVRQGPASQRMMHELLSNLSVLQGSSQGNIASLLEVIPPGIIRDSTVVIVTTRTIRLSDEVKQATKQAEAKIRGLSSKALVLNVTEGELSPFFQPKV